MKRKISVFLCIVISTVTLFFSYNQSVTAASAISEGVLNIAYALALHLGYVATDEAIYSVINNSDSLLARLESLIDDKNNDGTITLSEETMSEFKSLFDEYFAQEENLPDVVWMPVVNSDDYPASKFYSIEHYNMFQSFMNEHDVVFIGSTPKSERFYISDISVYYLTANQSSASNWTSYNKSLASYFNAWGNDYVYSLWSTYLLTYSGVLVGGSAMQNAVYQGYQSTFKLVGTGQKIFTSDPAYISINSPFTNLNSVNGLNGSIVVSSRLNVGFVPIFKNAASYKNWVTGSADYYCVQSSYTGGDITINPNTDYSVVYNNISQTIQNSYADGKDYSDILSDMQQSYESTMQEISESLGNIEDNTEESNSWLEKIYGKVSNIDNMISEQFNELVSTISDGFNSVIDSLTDISLGIGDIDSGDSGSGDGDSDSTHKSFWSRLGEFCSSLITGILSLLETVIMKAVDGLLYLANVVVDNASVALNGITEYMERYIDYFGEDTFLTNLGEALPQQIKDLIVFIVFGITAAGVIYMIKR